MARRLRVSSAGVPEHLIQRGNNRQATFACEEDMQAYVGWLKTYSKKYKNKKGRSQIKSMSFV
jgi:putative transposase